MYLGWFDDSAKPTAKKIADARQAYIDRFGVEPNVIMVNKEVQEAGQTIDGMAIKAASHIWRHSFLVGYEANNESLQQTNRQ